MLHPCTTTQFKKDQKKALKQNKDFTTLSKIMAQLIAEEPLEPKYCDHALKGNWNGFRDCHIENDWVLIYKVNKEKKTIVFTRLSTHSELFK
jgi:mRNA interferase YafQ